MGVEIWQYCIRLFAAMKQHLQKVRRQILSLKIDFLMNFTYVKNKVIGPDLFKEGLAVGYNGR
jgi:hypothetical protein